MAAAHPNSFKARKTLKVGSRSYTYFSLKAVEKEVGDLSRLPFSLRVLMENLLRHEDGTTVKKTDISAFAEWLKNGGRSTKEINFRPARVLMQDFTGVPAVVDLAAMRDAMGKLGGDPKKINPLVPVDLVIDHSVIVDNFGNSSAFGANVKLEYERNPRALPVPALGFDGVRQFPRRPAGHRHLPPGEPRVPGPGRLDQEARQGDHRLPRHAGRHRLAYHDGERPGRAGLGRGRHRGRGRHARPAAADGHSRRRGLQAHRQAQAKASTATDLVLTVTQMLRKKGVVGKFVEFYGEGLDRTCRWPTARPSPTWRRNTARPAASSRSMTITLGYLKTTNRGTAAQARRGLCQGAGPVALQEVAGPRSGSSPTRSSSRPGRRGAERCAGPKRPQDRIVLLTDAAQQFVANMEKRIRPARTTASASGAKAPAMTSATATW